MTNAYSVKRQLAAIADHAWAAVPAHDDFKRVKCLCMSGDRSGLQDNLLSDACALTINPGGFGLMHTINLHESGRSLCVNTRGMQFDHR